MTDESQPESRKRPPIPQRGRLGTRSRVAAGLGIASLATFAAALAFPGASGAAQNGVNPATKGRSDNVTLCHRTRSHHNPYVVITVDPAGAFDGHYSEHQGPVFGPGVQHWGDIIPPFQYQGQTYSLNWPAGEAIFENGCKV